MMNSRDKRRLGLPRSVFAILLVLALGGVLLSLYAARREASQYRALERLRMTEAVDGHFSKVQDHLLARENLAATVSALFDPPPLSAPRPLERSGAHVIALAPEISTVGWLPETRADQISEALQSLAQSGITDPKITSGDGAAIDAGRLKRPLYPILDIAPEKNRFVLGVDAGSFPDRLAAIERARDTREVTRTDVKDEAA
jgi:CHASE1-domain containing sensor protein